MASIDVLQIAIDGENRVLKHLEAIQQLGRKATQELKKNFSQASADAAKAMQPLEQTVGRVWSRLGADKAKLEEKITKPLTEAYQKAFKVVEGLATQTKTGQAIVAGLEKYKPRIEESIVAPFRQAMAKARAAVDEGMSDVRSRLGMRGGRKGPEFDPAQVAGLAQGQGGNFRQATRAADIGGRAGLNPKQLGEMISRMRELKGLGVPLAKQQQIIQKELGGTIRQFKAASQAARQFGNGGGGGLGGGGAGGGAPFGLMAGGVGKIALVLGTVVAAFAAATAVGASFYQGMIAANEQLNQEILGSAANLAATARVFKEGVEIVDPTEKIQELQVPLRNALKQVAEDSIQLVGVTSGELTSVFATLNSQASQLTGQSKEFTNAIDAAGKLTIDFSAALGTIGLPLAQAGQEIRSILMGQIDMNSTLAKQLGITNEMVNRWKAQGVLVDELRKRLQPFVEGNALAAKSIGGVSSNIKDVLEILQRDLGEPLLAPIVEGLEWIYEKLDANRDAIQSWLNPFINQAVEAGTQIAEVLVPRIEEMGITIEALQPFLLDLFSVVTMAITQSIKLVGPLFNYVMNVLQAFGKVYEIAKNIVALLPGFGDGGDAIDALAGSTQTLIDEQKMLEERYASLAEKKRQGIELTEEEKKQEEILKQRAAGAVAAVDEQIAAYRSIIPASNAERERIEAQIAALEDVRRAYEVGGAVAGIDKQIEALEAQKEAGDGNVASIDAQIEALKRQKQELGGFGSLMPEFGLTGAEINDIGNSFEQLGRQANDARNKIIELTEMGGQSSDLQQNAEALVKATQEQIKAGLITPEQAAEQLRLVAENNKIEVATRQQAQDAIGTIYEQASQRQVDVLADQIRDQQYLIDTGQTNEVAGVQRLTQLKQQQLQVQIQNVQKAIEIENALREAQVAQQVANFDKELAELQEALTEAANGYEANAVRAQIAGVQAQRSAAQASLGIQSEKQAALTKQEADLQDQLRQTTIDGEKAARDAQLREIERTSAQVRDKVALAASERQLALQEAINANPGMDPLDRAQKELDIKREQLNEEYQAEVEHRKRLQSLPLPNNPQEREAAEAQIRQSIQKTADMAIQLAKLEEEAQKQAIQRKQTEIDRATKARLNAIEKERMALEAQVQSYDQITKAMSRQLDLINEQVEARKSYDDATQSYYSIAAKFAKSDRERQKLEEQAAKARLAQLEEQQYLEEVQLKLKHQQTEAMLQQEIIQARIAKLQAEAQAAQARADYAKAAADPQTRPEELEALQLGILAADMKVGASDFAISAATQGYQDFQSRRGLEINQLRDRQGVDRLSAEADVAEITRSRSDDREIAERARGYIETREQNRDRGTGDFNNTIDDLTTEFDNLVARLGEFSVAPAGARPPSTGLPSPALAQASAAAFNPGQPPGSFTSGGGVINFAPTFNNQFGSSEPGQAAVREFEQGTLHVLKQVFDLV